MRVHIVTTKLVSLALAVFVAACGGGGGGVTPATNVIGGNNTGSGSTSGGGVSTPVQLTFLDAATPSPGAGPAPAQFASSSTRTPPPANAIFPLTQTVMQVNNTSTNVGPVRDLSASVRFPGSGVELQVYAIDAVLPGDGSAVTASSGDQLRLSIADGDYFFGGLWTLQMPQAVDFASFVGGYQTPVDIIPSSGSATYRLTNGALGVVFGSSASDLTTAALSGDVFLSVDFGRRLLTGTLTNVLAHTDKGTTGWNDVTFDGAILGGVNPGQILGQTAVASAPSAPFALKADAKGQLGGNFYGPNADEVGAVWTLRNSDGSGFAEGIAGAKKDFVFTGVGLPVLSFIGGPTADPLGPWTNVANPNIASPAAASKGTAPQSSPVAVAGGPVFDGSGLPTPANTVFPLTMTAMQITSGGLSVDTTTDTTGATLVMSASDMPLLASFRLKIPSLGVDASVSAPATFALPHGGGASNTQPIQISTFGLSYTGLGKWALSTIDGKPTATGTFAFGYETPPSASPTTGTATYTANGTVVGTVYKATATNGVQAAVGGDAALTANFATGAINGSFTHMVATTDGKTGQLWNDVSVSASIATGTSRFTGSTAAASAPSGSYALSGNATGHIDGGFYGPAANELGAVWTLSNSDGTGAAMGVVGARKQ